MAFILIVPYSVGPFVSRRMIGVC